MTAPRHGYGTCLLVTLLLYAATASPYIQWQDYGHFVQRAVEGELLNPLGLALVHPLHYWLGQAALLLPIEPPHALSLVSALAGALAVANVFGIVRGVTGRLPAAWLAAAALAVANTFWRMSTMPEVYTLTAALLTAEIWLLLRWEQTGQARWMVLVFAANGLSLANHNLALLTLPVIGLAALVASARGRLPWRIVPAALCAWLAGAAPYLVLVVMQWIDSGDLAGTIRSALFGNTWAGAVANVTLPVLPLLTSVAFTVASFPNLTLPLVVVGLAQARRLAPGLPYTRRVLGAALAIHLLFVLRYNVIDQYTFLVPAYALLAVYAGWGFHALLAAGAPRWLAPGAAALLLLTPAIYPAMAIAARNFNVLGEQARNKPYRDDYRYLLEPWGIGHTSAHQMSLQALKLAGDDGVIIVPDGMARFAVRYQMVRHSAAGVLLASDAEAASVENAAAAGRRIVYIPRRTDEVPPDRPFLWRAEGELFVAGGG